MKERPIIFCGSMVRAILDGRKTMTRRVCKRACDNVGPDIAWAVCPAQESGWIAWFGVPGLNVAEFTKKAYDRGFPCPYGVSGDRLWVRETFEPQGDGKVIYRADPDNNAADTVRHLAAIWKPSIFMPRWASRITLEVTAVRVERVQDISSSDAEAEGILSTFDSAAGHGDFRLGKETSHQAHFRVLWDSINAKRGFGWSVNPWVWVVQFQRLEAEAE